MTFYRQGTRRRATSTRASRWRWRRPGEPAVPVPRRDAIPPGVAAGHAPIASATSSWRRGCRSSSGAAFRTTSCSTWRERGQAAASRRCSSSRCAGCWPTARSRALVDQLRGAVAVPAQPGRRSRPTCACSRTSTTTCARRSGGRRSCSSRASCARTAACSTCSRRTTRSSTSGSRSTTAFRTSTAAASGASTLDDDSERGGLLGQGSILTVTSYATRTSPVIRGKWVLENLLGTPPPPPPPDVPALKDNTVVGGALDARAAGRASRQRGLRELPQLDGSGRVRAGELRRGRPLATRTRTASRSMRPAACPTAASSTGVAGLEAGAARSVPSCSCAR